MKILVIEEQNDSGEWERCPHTEVFLERDRGVAEEIAADFSRDPTFPFPPIRLATYVREEPGDNSEPRTLCGGFIE